VRFLSQLRWMEQLRLASDGRRRKERADEAAVERSQRGITNVVGIQGDGITGTAVNDVKDEDERVSRRLALWLPPPCRPP